MPKDKKAAQPASKNEKTGKKLGVPAKLCFSFIFLILFFTAAEIFFRMFPHRDSGTTFGGFVDPDPDLIWRLRPMQGGPFATNELGFRDGPFDRNARIKILILGDSVSWGHGVLEPEYLYANQLEARLNSDNPEKPFEVVNSGVPGYSTFQELRYLELRGIDLKPNMIILQFCLNDVFERYLTVAQYGGDNVFQGVDTRGGMSGLFGRLFNRSRMFEAIVRAAINAAKNREEYDVMKLTRDELSPDLKKAWEKTTSEIEGIRLIAQKNNIPFLLMISPYRFQLDDPVNKRQPQDTLVAYCNEKNIPYLDLLPYFVEFMKNNKAGLFVDEDHYSPIGHSLTAELLAVKTVISLRNAQVFQK